jgi:hypothetical protein
MRPTHRLAAVTFVSLALLSGCGGSREASQTVTSDTAAVTPAVPPPDASVPAWVAEVRQGEAQLGQTVEEGRLGEVHDQAVKLQGLLKQISGQAGSLTPEQRHQLTDHLAAADRLVDELHDAGDAGDLTKAKAKFQEFQTHVRAIEGVFGVTAS